jgi:3-methylfumaryl-CoA hydratase
MAVDIAALKKHIGRRSEEHDTATPVPMQGLIVTFDRKEAPPKAGEPIPTGWHHAYFLPMSKRSTLSADGLPTEGGVLPKMPFPRRMFAGIAQTFHEPIRIGDPLRRETELTDISLRDGATGQLIFTTQVRRISGPRGLCVVETYEGVFREEVPAGKANPVSKREGAPADAPWRRTIEADPVSLFRFSALTFNPHRIHYDRTYATTAEGYPGLVVHGPYSQQCLMDFARDQHPGKAMMSFSMRARAPLFDTAPFTLVGRPVAGQPDACELWAVTPEGSIAMQATATFA